jgi:hypothetical protein
MTLESLSTMKEPTVLCALITAPSPRVRTVLIAALAARTLKYALGSVMSSLVEAVDPLLSRWLVGTDGVALPGGPPSRPWPSTSMLPSSLRRASSSGVYRDIAEIISVL